MKCKKCGTEISKADKTCPNCHAEINSDEKKANVLAIIGFIAALIGTFSGKWTFCAIPVIGLVLSIIGLVRSKKCNSGKGLSIAGIVISALSLVTWFFVIILALSI